MRNDLRDRSMEFALRIVKLYHSLQELKGAAWVLSKQILRSGTSIGANISEAIGAQSEADYLTKYSIAVKEAHETQYWLELLIRAEIIPEDHLTGLK